MRPATRTPRPRYSGRLDRPSSSYGSALRPLGGPPGAAAPVSSRIHSGSRRLPLLGLPGLGGGPAGATTLSHIGGWSAEAKNSFSSACASGVTPFFGSGGGSEKAPVLDEPLSSEEKVPGPYEGAGGSAGLAGDSYGLSSKPDRNEESRKDSNADSTNRTTSRRTIRRTTRPGPGPGRDPARPCRSAASSRSAPGPLPPTTRTADPCARRDRRRSVRPEPAALRPEPAGRPENRPSARRRHRPPTRTLAAR